MDSDNAKELRQQFRQAALEYHEFPTPGKISVTPTKQLTNQRDLALEQPAQMAGDRRQAERGVVLVTAAFDRPTQVRHENDGGAPIQRQADRWQRGLDAGLLINVAGGNTVRLLPPLLINVNEARELAVGVANLIRNFT